MASLLNAVLCALVAAVFWTVLGYALARHVLPRTVALGAAPVVGWATFCAATLPLLTPLGFSAPMVVGFAVLALIAAAGSLLLPTPAEAAAAPRIPVLAFVGAAILALIPASAIVPKISATGVHLADPIFDHAKIAIVDAMARQSLPPVNPVFGEFGAAGKLAYYYLWHFSAAEAALPLHVSGWEADIALTWFTAFASLALMIGIAAWLGKKPAAAFIVVALAAAASLRETVSLLFGSYRLEPFLQPPTGFAGWLFQAAWVPQHLMSASCVVTAMLLLVRFTQRQSVLALVVIALTIAAGFESSVYVGGVTFAVAGLVAAPLLISGVAPQRRRAFVVSLAISAVLVLALVAPFIRDQWETVAARGGSPLALHPFEVLGDMVALRHVLDLPAYWFVLLPIEFPAAFIAGLLALIVLWRRATAGAEKTTIATMAVLCGAGLGISWLLVSTVGDNNDLGLRAVLPALLILIAVAAAGAVQKEWRTAIVAAAFIGLVASLPDTARMTYSNIVGRAVTDDSLFAQAPELWSAVRRYAGPTARVANNPLYLQDLTPWPVNMSWALLADRSSCFAGREMALAFASLPPARREAVDAQFIRAFAGNGTPDDIEDLARKYSCDVVVVVPQDGAWDRDSFAASRDYALAETRKDRWRIYIKAPDWRAR